MNPIDAVVSYFNPMAGLKRSQARKFLARYEAAEPSRMRKFYTRQGNQNELYQRQGQALVVQVRHLMRNHDLARGALRTLVNNIAGPTGISVEPQPRNADGTINKDYAAELRELWRDWGMHPEVTGQMNLSKLQRATARSWLRDGEVFGQFVQGNIATLDHNTTVPLSLEMFETEFVPHDYTDPNRKIAQGIQRNDWGRPTALHAYKIDPWRAAQLRDYDMRIIPWERVLHVASLDHFGQMRGIPEFASVITRLEDIKDYEESERVAAKVAAMLTAYVKKGTPDLYDPDIGDEPRELDLSPGMIMDDLMPGEEVGLIDSKRPNNNLIAFRQGQLRAAAAGIGASYSSISKDYSGTYSAQRQELVEQWANYSVLADDFVSLFVGPVWRRFVLMATTARKLSAPTGIKPESINDALFVAQAMPWIDPLKEALGSEALVKAGFASEMEIIRRRGRNPHELLDQVGAWREECEERGITFTSNAAAMEAATIAANSGVPDEQD